MQYISSQPHTTLECHFMLYKAKMKKKTKQMSSPHSMQNLLHKSKFPLQSSLQQNRWIWHLFLLANSRQSKLQFFTGHFKSNTNIGFNLQISMEYAQTKCGSLSQIWELGYKKYSTTLSETWANALWE